MALLGGIDEGNAYPRKGMSGPRQVVVLCTDDVAEGGNTLLDQCYPATMYDLASDIIYPPGAATRPFGTPVLLTVLGQTGAVVVPVPGKPYVGFLTGDIETDGSGSLIGRPRVISVEDTGPIKGAALAITTGAITLTNNVTKLLDFDTEEYDNLDYFTPTSANMNITDGLHLLVGYVVFVANAVGQRTVMILQGAANIKGAMTVDAASAGTTALTVSAIVYAGGGGAIYQLGAFQNSGGNLNVSSSARFSAVRLMI